MDATNKQAAETLLDKLVNSGTTPNVTVVDAKGTREGYIENARPPFIVVAHTATDADFDLDLEATTKLTIYDDCDVAHVFPDAEKRMVHCPDCETEGRKASTWHIEQWRKLDADAHQCPKGHKHDLKPA